MAIVGYYWSHTPTHSRNKLFSQGGSTRKVKAKRGGAPAATANQDQESDAPMAQRVSAKATPTTCASPIQFIKDNYSVYRKISTILNSGANLIKPKSQMNQRVVKDKSQMVHARMSNIK